MSGDHASGAWPAVSTGSRKYHGSITYAPVAVSELLSVAERVWPRPSRDLNVELREQREVLHVREDGIMRHQGNIQPDHRGGHPAVGLMVLAA